MALQTTHAQEAIVHGEGALGLLLGEERRDAERLLELCRERWLSKTSEVGSPAAPEIRLLSETLARRGAKAMPFGALGRALLADLHGSEKDAAALLLEFQSKLAMLGL